MKSIFSYSWSSILTQFECYGPIITKSFAITRFSCDLLRDSGYVDFGVISEGTKITKRWCMIQRKLLIQRANHYQNWSSEPSPGIDVARSWIFVHENFISLVENPLFLEIWHFESLCNKMLAKTRKLAWLFTIWQNLFITSWITIFLKCQITNWATSIPGGGSRF